MPPLRAEMKIGEREIKLPEIVPGLPASITDTGERDPSILVVECNLEDNGGVIYRQDPQNTAEIFNRQARLVASEGVHVEALIGKDETISVPVTTKFGKAVLSITHHN